MSKSLHVPDVYRELYEEAIASSYVPMIAKKAFEILTYSRLVPSYIEDSRKLGERFQAGFRLKTQEDKDFYELFASHEIKARMIAHRIGLSNYLIENYNREERISLNRWFEKILVDIVYRLEVFEDRTEGLETVFSEIGVHDGIELHSGTTPTNLEESSVSITFDGTVSKTQLKEFIDDQKVWKKANDIRNSSSRHVGVSRVRLVGNIFRDIQIYNIYCKVKSKKDKPGFIPLETLVVREVRKTMPEVDMTTEAIRNVYHEVIKIIEGVNGITTKK